MKAEKIQKEQTSRTIQPMRKGGGAAQFADNRNIAQFTSSEDEEESLQLKKDSAIQRKPNNTGLPDNLKTGVENLSGLSMDDVRVHYNSSKPAAVQALAYTQGTDIHVAPGQEQHLPHEAWHVVQQMQGRVQPTTEVGGMPVNNDVGLEREADVMGGEILQMKKKNEVVYQKFNSNTCQCVLDENREQFWSEKLGAIHVFLLSQWERIESSQIPSWRINLANIAIKEIYNALYQINMFFSFAPDNIASICIQISIAFESLEKYGQNIPPPIKNVISTYNQAFLSSKQHTKKSKLYLENREEYKEKDPSAFDILSTLKSKTAHRVLDATDWTLSLNDTFIEGGIDNSSRFKFKTEKLTEIDYKLIRKSQSSRTNRKGKYFLARLPFIAGISNILYDKKEIFPIRVLAREIAQLLDAGYFFMKVPSNKDGEKFSYQAIPMEKVNSYLNEKRKKGSN